MPVCLCQKYFINFPWKEINSSSIGFDAGSGTGRWAYFVAPKVKFLHCIEPSNAIFKSKLLLEKNQNIQYQNSTINEMDIQDNTMDFGYSLGVLHHTQYPENNLKICVSKLKKNAPFLLYLYFSTSESPIFYNFLWKISNMLRYIISRLPFRFKNIVCDLLAILIYFPLAKVSKILNNLKISTKYFPLSCYFDKSFYIMRNDALDRFGTKVEKRYTKNEMLLLMKKAGLINIKFNSEKPFWTAVGFKK